MFFKQARDGRLRANIAKQFALWFGGAGHAPETNAFSSVTSLELTEDLDSTEDAEPTSDSFFFWISGIFH